MSKATIEKFYAAFAQLDAGTMERCYADNARFDDEAFSLRGQRQIGAMWHMLCDTTRDKGRAHWRLRASEITERTAHWEAQYLFSATGRVVHNSIDAEFVFDDAGLIVQHRDRFNFWRWARQALGAPGWWLGWTPFLRAKVRAQAAANLQRFMDKR
jgi:hypothetical protein